MKKKEERDFLIALGKRITEIRKKKKLTQIEVAYRCDNDRGNIRRLEAGRGNPTAVSLLKLSKALEVQIDDFFKGLE